MIVRIKPLIVNIAVPLIVGIVAGILTMGSQQIYASVEKPSLSPPAWLFPVVWSVLYILMGISAYLVYTTKTPYTKNALYVYGIQLAVNFLWPIIFFNLGEYFIAFIVLCVLWVLVVVMSVLFYRVRPIAGWLQIPYILWLTFAGYLNYMVYMLN